MQDENSADRTKKNFLELPSCIAQVDEALGPERLHAIACRIFTLIMHADLKYTAFNSRITDSEHQSRVFTLLASAAVELETGWNSLRCGSPVLPARCCRAALEFVAVAVISSLGRQVVEDRVTEQRILKRLRRYPERPLVGLYAPGLEDAKRVEEPSVLEARHFLTMLPDVTRGFRTAPAGFADETLRYIREYLNPLSHGSIASLAAYMVPVPDSNTVGAFYHPAKKQRFLAVADNMLQFGEYLGTLLYHACSDLDAAASG